MNARFDRDSQEKRSGRMPEGPAHARKGSPWQTVKRTWTEFTEDELTDRAAALTYYGVLSIFPALIALVSIVGLVFDPARSGLPWAPVRQRSRCGTSPSGRCCSPSSW
jgi:hypothetical protein